MTTQRLKRRVKLLVLALLMSVAGALVYTAAHAAVTGEWRVNLLRGTTTVQPYSAGATQEAAWAACQARIPTNATVKATYSCKTPVYVAVVMPDPPPPANTPPILSGTPPSAVVAGQPYSFVPTATDADGDSLTFTIANRPAWAAFSATNGLLSGVPAASNVGVASGLVVSVSDGKASASTPVFTITVTQPVLPVLSQPTLSAVRVDSPTAGRHTITLSWTASENATTYSVERCTVALPAAAPCTNFAGLLGAGALTTLSFANTNLPAGFSYSYRLRGRDGLRDLSSPYSNAVTIVIPAEVAAMISWTPPTQHTDGTPLTNLAGYRLEYDDVPAEEAGPTFDKPAIVINNPGVSSYAVTNLAPGAWHFRVKAFNSVGVDSQPSNIAVKVIK